MVVIPRRTIRRDRVAVLVGLVGVVAVSWLYLIDMAGDMSPGSMGGMMPMSFGVTFLMWAVMMVGMMVPTAIPMTLLYASVARRARQQQQPVAPTLVFVGGYVAMWTVFSLAASAGQVGLERAALLSPMMVSTSPVLGGALLIGAGIYQLTSVKQACLRHCRSPAHFISETWRDGAAGAFRMGLHHGVYCLGCCWALMALLFVGGVMNLLWVAAIAVFVLLEKTLPFGERGGRVAGSALLAIGALALAGAVTLG